MKNRLLTSTGRIEWLDGQVLAARDLRDDHRDAARRRRLHSRYVHGTWGIALGFSVRLSNDQAAVVVGPGNAVDAEGHDLLLADTLRVPLPAADGVYILSARYEPYDLCPPRVSTAEFCPGADPRRERARIAWAPAHELDMGVDVPLGRAVINQGKITGDLDTRVRRNARRMIRPHLAWGVTETGATGWMDVSALKAKDIWTEAQIDTSDAGFLRTPRYFAALCRQSPPRRHPRKGSLDEATAVFGDQPAFVLDGLGFIFKPSTTGFTYRLVRGALPVGLDLTASEAEAGGWTVAWLGMEQISGCEPKLNLQSLIQVLTTL